MESIKDIATGSAVMAFSLVYGLGGFVGAVWWAIERDILFVVLSIFVPMFGGLSVIMDMLSII